MRMEKYRMALKEAANYYDQLGCWGMRDLFLKWLSELPKEAA